MAVVVAGVVVIERRREHAGEWGWMWRWRRLWRWKAAQPTPTRHDTTRHVLLIITHQADPPHRSPQPHTHLRGVSSPGAGGDTTTHSTAPAAGPSKSFPLAFTLSDVRHTTRHEAGHEAGPIRLA